jgi:radical S-adenosyl methionine domain-containing protein 2
MEEGYVINLHLLEQCNYQCKHCFAHFGSKSVLPIAKWETIIDNITSGICVKRFNLAGGEPLLYPYLDTLIDHIRDKGIQVSLITNGFLLTQDHIRQFCGRVSMVGLSIDALEPETLRKMGRCTANGDYLTEEELFKRCETIKKIGISLKINTVVSKLNCSSDLTALQNTCPDRWKILKMKPFRNGSFDNSALDITDAEFNHFLSLHSCIKNTIVENSMANAYIMVDANGFLVDNSNDNYDPVADLFHNDFAHSFQRLNLNTALYNARYQKQLTK